MKKNVNTEYSNNSSIKDYIEIELMHKRKKVKMYALLLFYVILVGITVILI